MAFGGYISGVIFDLTSSYRMAFLNGVLWNAFNIAIVSWLFWRRQKRAPAGAFVPAEYWPTGLDLAVDRSPPAASPQFRYWERSGTGLKSPAKPGPFNTWPRIGGIFRANGLR